MTTTIKVERVEVIQSIQNGEVGGEKTVPLIAGKDTYVRVFLKLKPGTSESVRLKGMLTVNGNVGKEIHEIESLQPVTLTSAPGPRMLHRRMDWNSSLNFRVSHKTLEINSHETGEFEFSLSTLSISDDVPVELADGRLGSYTFHATNLQIRILAIRYQDIENRDFLEPSDAEIDAVRRKLNALFPIRKLSVENANWSSVRIEATEEFRALNDVPQWNRHNDEVASEVLSKLFVQILLHRDFEITHCDLDEKTIYLALLVDPSLRFGGLAMDSPRFPTPHIVGIASTDEDGTLAAHEIAHILGCQHPGLPAALLHGDQIGQHGKMDDDQRAKMNPLGYISKNLNSDSATCIGLDASRNSVCPELLSPDRYYDLMTYLYPQWLSDYHYRRIGERIRNINKRWDLKRDRGEERCWTVICRYNLNSKEGKIISVVRSDFVTPGPTLIEGEISEEIYSEIDQLNAKSFPTPTSKKLRDQQAKLMQTQFTKYALLNCLIECTDKNERQLITSDLSGLHGDHLNVKTGLDEKYSVSVTIRYTHGLNGKVSTEHVDKVYFRGIGKEKHHPFGILQHTIKIAHANSELEKLSLYLDNFQADEVVLPTEVIAEGTRNKVQDTFSDPSENINGSKALDSERGASRQEELNIDKNIDQSISKKHISNITLSYVPRKDIYKIRIRYTEELLKKAAQVAQITTTILASRPRAKGKSWEVVSVRDGLEQSFWVSREFIEPNLTWINPRNIARYSEEEIYDRFVSNQLDRPLYHRKEDSITIRVLIKVGSLTPELSGLASEASSSEHSFVLKADVKKPKRKAPPVDASTLSELNPDLWQAIEVEARKTGKDVDSILHNQKNPQDEERFFVKIIPGEEPNHS